MKTLLRKIIVSLIAGSMLAVSAGVLVVGAAFALFGVLRPLVGGPGAAALVALAAAVLAALVALLLERWILRPPGAKAHRGGEADDKDLLQRLIGMAQDKPLIAAGALIGAIFLAIRNPALTAVVVKAFLDPKPRPGKKA